MDRLLSAADSFSGNLLRWKVILKLGSPWGRSWVYSSRSCVRGYAFVDDHMLQGEELLVYMESALDISGKSSLRWHSTGLERLNGCFSAIIQSEGRVYLIADKMKTYPLYYFVKDGSLFISDSEEVVLRENPTPLFLSERVWEYAGCGYLFRGDTLWEGVALPGPASVVVWEDGQCCEYTYAIRSFPKQPATADYQERALCILERIALHLREILGGRPCVIPLSGGYDSRLLACLCKMYHVKDVSCYTYGIENSAEVSRAWDVAGRLGFPLIEIRSDAKAWDEIFSEGGLDEYLEYGGGLYTTAHLQDFCVVAQLRKKHGLPPGSVIVPGHSGDLLGGSHFHLSMNPRNLCRMMYDKYYSVNDLKGKARRVTLQRLADRLEAYGGLLDREACFEAVYQWNIDSRQPNYIINSVRAYEFFGYDWALPLWDDLWVEFWASILAEDRVEKNLYDSFMFNKVFSPLGVDWKKQETDTTAPFWRRWGSRFLSPYARYKLKEKLAGIHLYNFPPDNSALDYVASRIREKGQASVKYLSPHGQRSMSAKTLYRLWKLGYGKGD